MLFNSLEFLVFFPVVTILYFLLPHRHRWLLLLLASCGFYMAFVPAYILILAVTIVVDYFAGLLIERSEGATRKRWLVLSIIANVGVLAVFKYWDFINENLEWVFGLFGLAYPKPELGLILPIGLSFHTFQSLAYTVEVYQRKQVAEKRFGIFALYVMFYPQLVAGPIERAANLLHQFYREHFVDGGRIASGLRLMAWGMFKKVVIADRLAVGVNNIYGSPFDHAGPVLALATVLFAIQIYCDFSGYSDIALGTARVMGFTLMLNFRQPYHATSISEFWKRWHISLSTWFRDYVYIPLGGNRTVKWRWYYNLFITFLISGLWHGASWNFVIWGALHGAYLVLAILFAPLRDRLARATGLLAMPRVNHALNLVWTIFLTCFAWIFFRATSFDDALHIATTSFTGHGAWLDPGGARAFISALGMSGTELLIALVAVIFMEAVHLVQARGSASAFIARMPAVARYGVYAALMASIIYYGAYHGGGEFIYFQF